MERIKLNYILTGTENPLFITEREEKIIDTCLSLINHREKEIEGFKLLKEFLTHIKNHDYSFDYSDDHRYVKSGQASLNRLQDELKDLITVHGKDAKSLLEESLEARPEQFKDGLCRKTINNLFSKYL